MRNEKTPTSPDYRCGYLKAIWKCRNHRVDLNGGKICFERQKDSWLLFTVADAW